jgi:hypothetical protein
LGYRNDDVRGYRNREHGLIEHLRDIVTFLISTRDDPRLLLDETDIYNDERRRKMNKRKHKKHVRKSLSKRANVLIVN